LTFPGFAASHFFLLVFAVLYAAKHSMKKRTRLESEVEIRTSPANLKRDINFFPGRRPYDARRRRCRH